MSSPQEIPILRKSRVGRGGSQDRGEHSPSAGMPWWEVKRDSALNNSVCGGHWDLSLIEGSGSSGALTEVA